MKPLTVIILTYNEVKHLQRCIDSVRECAETVYVVDSGSTDGTRELAQELGATVLLNRWTNHATQLNWALDNCAIDTEWILRLDADEYILPDLCREFISRLPELDAGVTGVAVSRRYIFQGKWIRWGKLYPMMVLRVWRVGRGRCEQRLMDEHVVVDDGRVIIFRNDFVDENLNDLTWWTNKHNRYASLEAIENFATMFEVGVSGTLRSGRKSQWRRMLKTHIYGRLPFYFRAALFFFHRVVFGLAVLDGRRGLVFHFLQGFWYRFLVDAKTEELIRHKRNHKLDVFQTVSVMHDIDLKSLGYKQT